MRTRVPSTPSLDQQVQPAAIAIEREILPRASGGRAPFGPMRAPLIIKLLGAHVFALGVVVAFILASVSNAQPMALVVVAAVATLVFGSLAAVALLPLRGIEAVASRVWRGDFDARVGSSLVADHDIKRIGTTFNLLLDGLVSDRARMRALASAIIDAGDRERATLARELHDSTAQQLAALQLQLSVAARDCTDPAITERLKAMRKQANDALEEVRLLSHTIHPRVLDDLGLAAALKKLAREATEVCELEVEFTGDIDGNGVPPTAAAVLYRVAQAAVHNVMRHADARHLKLRLTAPADEAVLEIIDDGHGFDVDDAERHQPGMGLFTMRERVALAGGRFDVRSKRGAGTCITATVPIADHLAHSNGRTSDE